MELSPYVEGLRRDLGSLTRFAPDEVTKVAEQLAEALDSPVRLILLDVLTTAAAEITQRLDETVIDVRLSGGEPEFVVTAVTPHQETPLADAAPDQGQDEATARITLRLSEGIKARVEAQAAATGISVNGWLAHAVIRALELPGPAGQAAGRQHRSGPGQRISGFARS